MRLVFAAVFIILVGATAMLSPLPLHIQEKINKLDVAVYEAQRPFPGWENPLNRQVLDQLTWAEAGQKWMAPDVQETYMPGCLEDWCDNRVCLAVSGDLLGEYNDRVHPVAFGLNNPHSYACDILVGWKHPKERESLWMDYAQHLTEQYDSAIEKSYQELRSKHDLPVPMSMPKLETELEQNKAAVSKASAELEQYNAAAEKAAEDMNTATMAERLQYSESENQLWLLEVMYSACFASKSDGQNRYELDIPGCVAIRKLIQHLRNEQVLRVLRRELEKHSSVPQDSYKLFLDDRSLSPISSDAASVNITLP